MDRALDRLCLGGIIRTVPRLAAIVLAAATAADVSAGVLIGNPRHDNPFFEHDSSYVERSEMGLVFGSPALFNVEFGWWPDPVFGGRASGMFYGRQLSGLQASLCLTVDRSLHRRHAIALLAGSIQSGGEYFDYVGPGVDNNFGPFFLELGLCWARGTLFSTRGGRPYGLFQVGVMGGGGIYGPRTRRAAPSPPSAGP